MYFFALNMCFLAIFYEFIGGCYSTVGDIDTFLFLMKT